MSSTTNELGEPRSPNAIYLTIPPRLYILPGAAVIVGTVIGLKRGSRRASMQFLAENVHRPPTTLQGWYFYNKTKNYKVILGGLQQAGTDAGKLAMTALGWVGVEEGMERAGWGEVAELGAGLGTAGVFSALCEWGSLFTVCIVVVNWTYRSITMAGDEEDYDTWIDDRKQYATLEIWERLP